MHKFSAHAATDVTGFGLLGHAQNLAESQTRKVNFIIHSLPVIGKMTAVARAMGNSKFLAGTTPETSGKNNFFFFEKYITICIVFLIFFSLRGSTDLFTKQTCTRILRGDTQN